MSSPRKSNASAAKNAILSLAASVKRRSTETPGETAAFTSRNVSEGSRASAESSSQPSKQSSPASTKPTKSTRKSIFQKLPKRKTKNPKKRPLRSSSHPEMTSKRNVFESSSAMSTAAVDGSQQDFSRSDAFTTQPSTSRIRTSDDGGGDNSNLPTPGDDSDTTSSDSDSVVMPAPPAMFLTDRSTSVSLESLKRQQLRVSSRSSNSRGSDSAFSEEVSLNFERIQSTFFGNDNTNSSSPPDQLWEAYQRVLHRGEEEDAVEDLSLPPPPLSISSSSSPEKRTSKAVTSQDAAEYMSGLMKRDSAAAANVPPPPPSPKSATHKTATSKTSDHRKTVETVFIHGASGVGKSFLFDTFKKRLRQNNSNEGTVVGILEATHPAVSSSSTSHHIPKGLGLDESDHYSTNSATFHNNNNNSQREAVTEPFVAFRAALGQLFDFLVQLQQDCDNGDSDVSTEMLERLSTKLNDMFLLSSSSSRGAVVRYLMKSFPALKKILSFTRHSNANNSNADRADIDASQHYGESHRSSELTPESIPSTRGTLPDQDRTTALKQLGLVFIRILRVVAETLPPVTIVLFIDDLQWADPESLDLSSTLVGETKIDNLLFVGAFRNGESPVTTLSPYSVVLRKNYHRNVERLQSPGRSGAQSSSYRPAKLAPTQTWSAIRARSNVFGLQTSNDRPQLKKKTKSVEHDLADDSDLVPTTAPLRKAVTLGSYNAPERNGEADTISSPRSADDIHLLTLSPTKHPTRVLSGTSLPHSSDQKQAPQIIASQVQPGNMKRTLSLISDDESVEEDDFPTGHAIPMVPPPVSFGSAPTSPADQAPASVPPLPPLPPPLSPLKQRSQSPKFLLSNFRNGSRRNIATRGGGLDKVVEEESSPTPSSPSKITKAAIVSDHVVSAAVQDRKTRKQNKSERPNAVSETVLRNTRSRGLLRREPSSSHLSQHADDDSNGKQSSFAASMFRNLPIFSIGNRARSTQYSDFYVGARDALDSNSVNIEIPPSPQQLLEQYNVSDISLGVWDVGAICQCVSRLLNVETSDCEGLAAVLERKTHGNPSSVLRLLEFLHQDGLLFFSLKTYRWDWDEEHIDSVTMATSDVGELLAARVKHLPSESLSVLKVAACIGNSFNEKVLETVVLETKLMKDTENTDWKSEGEREKNFISLKRVLQESCDAGLLESRDNSEFRFSHDLVQQNLYSKIKDEDLSDLHLTVANAIKKTSGSIAQLCQGSSKSVFLCANHYYMGRSNISTEGERLKAIELNLHASATAKRQCSFRAAAIFLERAISDFLTADDWRTNYSLTFEVFSCASEVLYSCGDLDKSSEYAHEVIEHARCVEERLRGHFVVIDVLATERRYNDALNESFGVLETLGCQIPRKFKRVHLYKDLRILKKKLVGKTLDYFQQMKTATDVVDLSILRIMDTMTLLLALKGDTATGGLLMTKMILVALGSGMSVYVPYSLAGFGMLLVSLGDIDEGYRYGELALKLAESFRSKRALTRTAFCVYTFLSWTRKPLVEGIEVMLNAHRMGLQVGDIEYSSMCLGTYANLYIAVGLPLNPFVDDLKQFLEQLELYNQNQSIAFLLCFYQMSLNLTGRSQTYLSGFRINDDGEAMQLENYYYRFMPHGDINDSDQGVTFANLKFATLLLSYIFQDIDELKDWFLIGKSQKDVISSTHFIYLYATMFSGLAAFSIYRSTRQTMYFRKALSSISTLKALSKKAGINILPLKYLLHAERRSFTKDSVEAVKKSYDEAITSAARCGLIHLEAIACERAGDFLSLKKDRYWSQSYYERAIERYSEWGAISKADILSAKNAGNSEGKTDRRESVSIAVRGKRRYDPNTWNTLQKADIVEHASSHKRKNYL